MDEHDREAKDLGEKLAALFALGWVPPPESATLTMLHALFLEEQRHSKKMHVIHKNIKRLDEQDD